MGGKRGGGLDHACVSATIVAQQAWEMRVALKLILGSKNYSSWSLRPWLAMTVAGIPFEETVLPIHTSNEQPNAAAEKLV